jgi:hypothetical protein
MDAPSAFGLFAVTAMLVTYAIEPRHAGFILVRHRLCRPARDETGAKPMVI